MLSIFGIPKPFRGHVEVIQLNAIQSWTRLHPDCQVILAGNEFGTKEVAKEFGACHVPDIALNENGTPLENSVLQLAEQVAEHRLMCSLASDIILMGDVVTAVERIELSSHNFVMFSQRWNLSITDPIDFGSDWEEELRSQLNLRGRLYTHTGMDYMVYPCGLFEEVPPFAVGRRGYDNWLLYAARLKGADLVDATPVVKAVHQDHDYVHHPQGVKGVMYGPEAQRNTELIGSRSHRFIIKDRTHILTHRGLKRALDLWRVWRLLRTFDALYATAPSPVLWSVRAVNFAVDVGAKIYWQSLRLLRIKAPHEVTTGL